MTARTDTIRKMYDTLTSGKMSPEEAIELLKFHGESVVLILYRMDPEERTKVRDTFVATLDKAIAEVIEKFGQTLEDKDGQAV